MQAFNTGEPGNAPAWKRKVPSAAVMRPSRVAPSLTLIAAPEVGPVALKTSSRLIASLTGRPLLRARARASGSRYTTVLPPNPPPISAGVTRRSESARPRSLAVKARIWKCPWLEPQISACPSSL